MIIEERDPESKEVFFNCIETETGDIIFKNFQLEERFWIGIEKIFKGIIIFHKYEKPDLPRHKGIISFDIEAKKILWENADLIFLFIHNENLFCYRDSFDGRLFYKLEIRTGNVIEELGSSVGEINKLRENITNEDEYMKYRFPEIYLNEKNDENINKIVQDLKNDCVITGPVEIVNYSGLLLISYFEVINNGLLNNIFRVFALNDGKLIFKEKLNSLTKTIIPDTFFIIDNLVFLLINKVKLVVCEIKK